LLRTVDNHHPTGTVDYHQPWCVTSYAPYGYRRLSPTMVRNELRTLQRGIHISQMSYTF
jgi:hypothetical protein